jgi:hypothetical protein
MPVARMLKMNRSEVSSKWNKYRIYVGDQLDRWSELKEVLRVQTRAEVAKILHNKATDYFNPFIMTKNNQIAG